MKRTAVDRHYIWLRDQGVCRYCGREISYGKMSLDHYYPRGLGGPDSVYNLVCSCKRCNVLKRSSLPEDWEPLWIQFFIKAVKDRKLIISARDVSQSQLTMWVETIQRTYKEGKNVIFENNYKRFHVKHNEILKITDINNLKESIEEMDFLKKYIGEEL